MRRVVRTSSALTLALAFGALPLLGQDAARAAEDGGIHVDGWMGQVDAGEAANGATIDDTRLAMDGGAIHVVTGPASVFWQQGSMASGDFTVSATFAEPAFMGLNNHPHPYGLFIGGQNMGTDAQTLLYCSVYGDGRFIVRGFGPAPFQVSERRPQPHEAINAVEVGEPVTQEIAISVSEGVVSCSVNGEVVGSYPVSDVVGEGMLSSTDGVWGLRFGHNTEARVTGLSMTGGM